MVTPSPMEIKDLCVMFSNAVTLFQERGDTLREFHTCLVKWKSMLERLVAAGVDTNDTAEQMMRAVHADLQLCEKRMKDGSWLNKVNIKHAIDEKETAEAVHKRMSSDMLCLHTELMLALKQQSVQQWQSIVRELRYEAQQRSSEQVTLQAQLAQSHAMGSKHQKAVESQLFDVTLELDLVKSFQTEAMANTNRQFEKARDEGNKRFEEISKQNAATLQSVEASRREMQQGFAENTALHARTLQAVQSGESNIISTIAALRKEVGERDARLLALLERVLADKEARDGVAVSKEDVEIAMAGGVQSS